MDERVKNTCDLIVANRNALKSKMFWEVDSNNYAVLAGFLTAAKGVEADPVHYKECKKILRSNVNFFSEIRGLMEAVVVTKMMMAEDPESYAQGLLSVYKKLRGIHKLTASPYMVMAAMNIYEHNGVAGADADIEKLEELYKNMKKQHPLLIWDEDRGYLSMIAVSGLNMTEVEAKIEASYEACKKIYFSKDVVHTLSQVLALSDMSAEGGCEFVKDTVKGLKANKTPISKSYGLAAIGALALLDLPEDQITSAVSEACDYLKGQKGFKWYDSGRRMRAVYAALAVFIAYSKDNEALSEMISSNITINIAEEIILITILAAESAAAASRSSSSSSSSN